MQSVNIKNSSSTKKYRKVGPYLLSNVIGKGSFSTVYEAKKQGESKKYAVKQISLVTLSAKQLERIRLEIKVLTHIKHENIVCLLDYKQTSRNLYLVFDYCKNTDLEAFTQKYNLTKLPEEKVKKIAIQIKNAFQVLRANKIVHRDLKLANILVTEDFEIKIADFGFAKYLDDNEFFSSYVGTPLTMAPEIMQNLEYNQKCDLWSLGILLYQLMFGKNPFFTKDRMSKLQLVNATKAELKIPEPISPEAEGLIRRLIVREPRERISFEDFFRHPWLCDSRMQNNFNEDLLEEALKVELERTLLLSGKNKDEKQFLLTKAHHLLSYEIIESVKNSIETKIMYWINLGKKIISMEISNRKLCFLSIALILENLQRCTSCCLTVDLNDRRKIAFSRYEQIRKLQKWEMSEYTKRLPGFVERSSKKMVEHLRQMKLKMKKFIGKQLQTSIEQLFLLELTAEMVQNLQNKSAQEQLSVLIKLKPSHDFDMHFRVSSSLFTDNTLDMLLKKAHLNIESSKMYKKCSGIFKIETKHHDGAEDRIYENLKQLMQ